VEHVLLHCPQFSDARNRLLVEFDRLGVPFELPLLLGCVAEVWPLVKRHAVLKAGLRFLSAVYARAHVVPVDG